MAYTTDKKSTGLDVLTTLATGDLHIVGDVSDSGRAKAITQNNLEVVIANSTNFIDELTANSTFITNVETIAPSPLTTKGDIFTHNATVPARLPVGTNGQVLVADSSETTGLKWSTLASGTGGGGTKLAIDTTETSATSTTPVTAYSIPIPAGTLGTNDAIRFKLILRYLYTGGSPNGNITIKYGGQALVTDYVISSSANQYIEFNGVIIANGATNSQKTQMVQFVNGNTLTIQNTSLTVDSTTTQNIEVITKLASAGSGSSVDAKAIIVEKISEGSTVSNVELVDDFLGGVYSTGATNEFYSISTLNWSGLSSGGNSIGGYINSETNHPGILRIEGGGTNEAAIFLGDPNNTIYPISQFAQSGNEYSFIVRCNDTTSQTIAAQIKVGTTVDVLSSTITNDEIQIVFDTTNNDIIFKTRNSTTTESTTIDSNFTNVFYNFKIVCGGTNVKCYQDGVLKATHSTSIPSTTANGSVTINTQNGEQLDVDLAAPTYQATR